MEDIKNKKIYIEAILIKIKKIRHQTNFLASFLEVLYFVYVRMKTISLLKFFDVLHEIML